ncbi:MAG: DUF3618 domain-containing protein [Pseudomonadota bacterium]
MSTTSTDPGNKSPGQIEREVEATRASVSGTLDELRGKFEPRQIVDQVVEQVADYARSSGGAEFARNLGASMRDNPLPVMLIGAGIGWLLLSGSNGSSTRYAPARRELPTGGYRSGMSDALRSGPEHVSHAVGSTREGVGQFRDSASRVASSATAAVGDAASRVSDAGSAVADRISGAASEGMRMAGDLGERVSDVAGRVGERVSDATATLGDNFDAARDSVSALSHDAMDKLGSLAEEQPLLLGLLGVALGAAVGAALPRTRTEDRLLGETRDTVVNRIAEVSGDALEEVRTVAGEQIEQVKGALAETYSDTRDQLQQGGVSGAGSALGNAASQAAQAVGGAVSNIAAHAASKVDEAGTPRDQRGAG